MVPVSREPFDNLTDIDISEQYFYRIGDCVKSIN
jgi:hypothetical protein